MGQEDGAWLGETGKEERVMGEKIKVSFLFPDMWSLCCSERVVINKRKDSNLQGDRKEH